jgi:hypothetical protein
MTGLFAKISSNQAQVVVVGIGYLALPLVAEFGRIAFTRGPLRGISGDRTKVYGV